ncbi:ATP synthase subunit alpha [Sedimentisphaera cyanobacteriorum]|uniref:ATP synthase subunit alpha n=1 Tax=Sedimentisphaera cyanobacteriorum TaxID=1940790 RepID=A0A1Q2HNK3_9BACT|nr:F0F1 ATP synthase subunit alpha [Sedimentisphaera cyanobacteriorum]AQQ09089.1 ATP synthase subunit alpha [Sedimentisphaera cyanobacteriorum]
MKLDVQEISSLIKKEISQYNKEIDVSTVGRVTEVGDGIAHVYGLENAMAGEILEFEGGVPGEVFNLNENSIGAVIYGDYSKISEGSAVKATGRVLTVPTGAKLLGRVVDPLCKPLDGKGEIESEAMRLVDSSAPGIADRQPVNQPLMTGLKSVDAMIPIGRGQRELIIGDRKTGKTAIALDAIVNQKGGDVVCVYVAIGQKESTVAEVVDMLERHGAMEHSVVVAANASDSAPLQYIAPYTGCAIAEHFMYKSGRDTLCVYDDLSKHAVAYREMSLLLRRPPGREAFPGDIFYLHSRLLERGVKLSDKLGGGSLTALPIVETLEGQVSAYIPTNIISITDGQIYLQRDLFLSGVRPAVDVGISVSRVGGDAQVPAMKKVAGRLRLDLASFRELEDFARLGTELDEASQAQLDRGYRMVELLKQPQFSPMSCADQVISIFAGSKGALDDIEANRVSDFLTELLAWMRLEANEYVKEIEDTGKISDELAEGLMSVIEMYKNVYRFSFAG